MKNWSVCPSFLFRCLFLAQSKFSDVSPLDVSYYPANYPLLKVQVKAAEPLSRQRVIYSRPQKTAVPFLANSSIYGKLWRLGANEATEIEFFFVTIGSSKVKIRYINFHAIPDSMSGHLF